MTPEPINEIERWTGRRLLRVAGPAAAVALAGSALAPNIALLMISAVVVGALFGVLNVALSVQAVAVELAAARPIMATMHGTWTLGAVAGGAAIATGLRIGIGIQVLVALGALAVASGLLAAGSPVVAPASARPVPAGAPRPGLVITLGAIGVAAFVAEGAATDWAGVHATRVLGADPAAGSLMYTVFFVAMTAVRFAGDTLRTRLGAAVTIRLAGATATAGYALVLIPGTGVTCAIVGWALVGAGIAVVWPVVISVLGAATAGAGRLSAVTTISYGGGLLGPAVIGVVATAASLPVALLIPAALAVGVATLAPVALAAVTGGGRAVRT